MAASIHGILLLMLPLATFLSCRRVRRRALTPTIAIRSAYLPILALYPLFIPHLCDQGAPFGQVLICGACLWYTSAVIANPEMRILSGFGLMITMFLFGWNWGTLIETREWTSDPGMARRWRWYSKGELKSATDALFAANTLEFREFPAGWLKELDLPGAGPTSIPPPRINRVEIAPAWHTFFTGLYYRRDIPQDYWYPGGRITVSAKNLELRDRPALNPRNP